jgi:hypothetical protein
MRETNSAPPCDKCERPAPLPGNSIAWDLYNRVHDQIESFPTDKDGKKHHVLIRTEAVEAIIRISGCDDPLETYDRIMMIHRTRYPNA